MKRGLVAPVAALLVAACGGGIETNSDFDPTVDFGAYDTYVWTDAAGTQGAGTAPTDLVDRRIRSAVDANLEAKGLRKVGSAGEADLAIAYQLAFEDNVQYNTVNTGWGGGYGYYGRWGVGMGTSSTYATTYTDGTLILGMFDVESKQMVWQGTGTKTIDEDASADQRTENINHAVARILEDFPPGQ